jgi:hypothetical protein
MSVYVSVYVYRYTYLITVSCRYFPCPKRVPVYVYLYLPTYLAAISLTAAVPLSVVGGQVLVLVFHHHQMVLVPADGSGRPWQVVVDLGRFWQAPVDHGRFWWPVAGSGSPWQVLVARAGLS